jgi:hypothetical protein
LVRQALGARSLTPRRVATPRDKPVALGAAMIVIAALCLSLAYGALSESSAAALSPAHAEVALVWRPGDAAALAALSESRAGEALTESEIRSALDTARAALKSAPLTVASVRTLAEVHQLMGDASRAEALMSVAGRRNLRDTKTQLWLFSRDMDRRSYGEGFLHADLILRRHPEMWSVLYPGMVATLDQPAARTAVLAMMRKAPNWRSDFIRVQANSGDPAGVTLWLLSNLASSPHPPTESEVSQVAQALAAQGRWSDVRAVWAGYGGDGASLLSNGDFERANRGPPFGWRMAEEDSTVTAIERIDGGANHGLFVQFPAGRLSPLTERLLILGPGRYRLSGRAKVEKLPADALFRWTVSCSGVDQPLALVQNTVSGGWAKFETTFEMPATGCDAQWLRLAGTGGVGYEPASAWYDDLRLERLP